MKAVVGVGYMDHCAAGLDIFVRLGFPDPQVVLVHTVEPVLPDGGFLPEAATNPIADIQRQRKEDGERRLNEVSAELASMGISSKSVLTFGKPSHEITALADQESADAIVAGAQPKGALESFFMGSVSRALVVEAKRSIIIGKKEVEQGRKINAVFATDHSEYANKCVEKLVSLAPSAIGKLTVVSADTSDPGVWSMLTAGMTEEVDMRAILDRKNESVAKKLSSVCESTASIVDNGSAEAVINAAMKQTGADILILGAHGHGFLERLVMGSTAIHMVANEPWNVFVVRA